MLPDKMYLQVLEHGKNMGRLEVVKELEQRLKLLRQERGIGKITMDTIYRVLEVEYKEVKK